MKIFLLCAEMVGKTKSYVGAWVRRKSDLARQALSFLSPPLCQTLRFLSQSKVLETPQHYLIQSFESMTSLCNNNHVPPPSRA